MKLNLGQDYTQSWFIGYSDWQRQSNSITEGSFYFRAE